MCKIYFRCGCGAVNYNLEDWICHFKHKGVKKGFQLLLKTRLTTKPY